MTYTLWIYDEEGNQEHYGDFDDYLEADETGEYIADDIGGDYMITKE